MGAKVLLIDDETEFLEAMADRLTIRGMTVSTAESVYDALQQVETKIFDAVVMDFMMPDMDGISALKALKKIKPELHVFLLTGYATVEKREEAIQCGADALFDKPANIDLLTKIIQRVYS
ncbi:response regulator [Desulfococcaceae bacterium HSG7]|nr:response regulator [Desulfococcaceae bacterium HSG9]MDM8554865.1 response regulator [Desulfococcaceae bacterium HSG7]